MTVLGGDDPPPSPSDLLRALRYPDRSLVIDLSQRPQDEKSTTSGECCRSSTRCGGGPACRIGSSSTRRTTSCTTPTPHHLLDLDANGYTFVTYWASRLPPESSAATEVMIVTRESNPGRSRHRRWWSNARRPIPRAGPSSAASRLLRPWLPITEEARGELVEFTLGPRLTPHVRHREKYVDAPVSEDRAFVFTPNGHHGSRSSARSASSRPSWKRHDLDAYLRRGDLSRWVADVFGDRPCGRIAGARSRVSRGPTAKTVPAVVAAIRARYELEPEARSLSANAA